MPPSISRCGWCRPTAAPRAMPASSTPCCGGSRATAPSDLAAPRHRPRSTRPDWLMTRWVAHLRGGDRARDRGRQRPRAGARSHREERPRRLGRARSAAACCRPVRCARIVHGPVSQLPGYGDGIWWVQDAAAALPAQLLGDVRGLAVADLCAAPGGKTAQLAAAGARVVAVDRSPPASSGCGRTCPGCISSAETVVADVDAMAGGPVRRRPARCALLVDRDHPPPPRHSLAQARARYCRARRAATPADRASRRTDASRAACLSIAPARSSRRRGIEVVRDLLERNPDLQRQPDVGGRGLRSRRVCSRRTATCARCPAICPTPIRAWRGLDGFYAARLRRN